MGIRGPRPSVSVIIPTYNRAHLVSIEKARFDKCFILNR